MIPTIYIGLGGTGIRAIAQTKKLYEDAYGVDHIPPQIAFMAMDFDFSTPMDKSLATDIAYDFLHLNTNVDPRLAYKEGLKANDYKWMFEGNGSCILRRIAEGAATTRTTGRFYTEMVLDKIRQRLQQCINQVRFANNEGHVGFNINIVTSLCGGTGCGSFINVAEMIRSTWPTQAHIVGYGVLHGVFCAMAPIRIRTPRIVANAYSAVMDLDFLMSASCGNPIHCTINGREQDLTYPIFDEFFVIDNETETGCTITDIKQMCEVLGNYLFASHLHLEKRLSYQDSHRWTTGQYDVDSKKGWVQALGCCQIVYKGDLLAKIYEHKAAIELIRIMLQEGENAEQIAQRWTEEVEIRGDDGYELLIDSIYSLETLARLREPHISIEDTLIDITTETYRYMNSLVDFPTENDIAILKESKLMALGDKLNAIMNLEHGIGNAKQFLAILKSYFLIWMCKMEQEATEFTWQLDSKTQAVQVALKEYEDFSHRFFFFFDRSRMEECLNYISSLAKSALRLALEIKRREAARYIYTALITKVEEYSYRVDDINKSLANLNKLYTGKIAEKIHEKSTSVFEYDLSYDERIDMPFNPVEINFDSFISKLSKPLLDMDIHYELKPAIDDYVSKLSGAIAYREAKITDVIENLSEKDFDKLFRFIKNHSSRLLRINDHGLLCTWGRNTPSQSMYPIVFITTHHENMPEIRDRSSNWWRIDPYNVEFTHSSLESLKQKIFICREDYGVIPYCIDSFDPCTIKDEYESLVLDAAQAGSTTFNPHFDKQIFDKMQQIGFSLKPESAAD